MGQLFDSEQIWMLVRYGNRKACLIEQGQNSRHRRREETVVHACGHDTHVAGMMGVSTLLVKAKNKWGGTLIEKRSFTLWSTL
jgi:hypothetical protein